MSEYSKAWKLANPEKVKEQKARWNAKHKEEIAARSRKRNPGKVDPVKRKASNAAWNLKNAEHKKKYNVAWEALNPESKKRRTAARRALLKKSGGKLSKGISERLLILQKGKCACCGAPLGDGYHMDHIMPLHLGGRNVDSNIQLLLPACNTKKQARHPVDYMQSKGFLL